MTEPLSTHSDLLRQTIDGYTREVIGWADRAGVPLMSPPRVPEAAQAMHDEIVRLRAALQEIDRRIDDPGFSAYEARNIARGVLRWI